MSTPAGPDEEERKASSEYLEARRLLEAALLLKEVSQNPELSLQAIQDKVDQEAAEAIKAHGPGLKAASQAIQKGAPAALAGVKAAAKEGLQELEPVLKHLVHELTENPRGDHAEALRRASGSINDACQRFVEKARECLQSNLMGPLSNILNNLVKLANKVSTLVTGAPMLSALGRSKEAKTTETGKASENDERKTHRDRPG